MGPVPKKPTSAAMINRAKKNQPTRCATQNRRWKLKSASISIELLGANYAASQLDDSIWIVVPPAAGRGITILTITVPIVLAFK